MVEQNAMAKQLMHCHATIAGESDRIGEIAKVGKREAGVANPGSARVGDAMCLNFVALGIIDMAAVVYRTWEDRARQISDVVKSQVFQLTIKAVTIVVGIDRGKIVGARVEVEAHTCVELWGRHDRI